ncbi:MAG: tRNA epoxyqueuosine(34) reductase QueG [Myxococcota bacterium]
MGDSLPGEALDAAGRSARVKAHARAVGFDLVGVAPTALPEAWERYSRAMDAGYGADMTWLTDNPDMRRDVRRVHPSARSVVMLGVSYADDAPGYLASPPAPDEGYIARYARGKDYHAHVRQMLVRLVRLFADDPALGYASTEHRIFVDTGPVLEKAFAARAGLGWIGKNTLLINRPGGSWYFLAEVLTPLDLAVDEAETDHCGGCRRCLDACPTSAFVEPYVLDARRCIANWTIESADPLSLIDPAQLGQHIFGCDICQEVCPWNRRAEPTAQLPLRARPANIRPKLADLAGLDEAEFKARFPKSAVRRTDGRRLGEVVRLVQARNAAAVDVEGESS